MTYLGAVYDRLYRAFSESQISIAAREDHVVVEHPSGVTDAKIREIVESVGFNPVVSEAAIEGKMAFSIVPYKIPACFNLSSPATSSTPQVDHLSFEEMTPCSSQIGMLSKQAVVRHTTDGSMQTASEIMLLQR